VDPHGDTLWLAKFTSVHDQQPIERVEVATLRLAHACGIRTPAVRLELADTPFPVALIQRFDRRGAARIPYISARTALGNALRPSLTRSSTVMAASVGCW